MQYYDMRSNLATDVADSLRQWIVEGELVAGQRINEVEIAAELEVSRTPLREALSRLTAEGFVESRPRRGFFVRELGAREVEDLYGIRAVLDPAALAATGLPGPERLARLAALNARVRDAVGDPELAIDRDDAWHLELLAECPNRVLLDLIRQFMQRTRPLERAYARDHQNVEAMAAAHDRILEALRAGDLEAAVDRLRENMEIGLDPILRWLEQRRGEPAEAGR